MAQMRWEQDHFELYKKSTIFPRNEKEKLIREKSGDDESLQAKSSTSDMPGSREKSICAGRITCTTSTTKSSGANLGTDHRQQLQLVDNVYTSRDTMVNLEGNIGLDSTSTDITGGNDDHSNYKIMDDTRSQKERSSCEEIAKHQDQIHKRHRRTKSTVVVNGGLQRPLLLLSIFLLVSGSILENSFFCACDNDSNKTNSITTIAKQQHSSVAIANPKTTSTSTQHQSKNRYKDKLITYLSDEIEKKHFSFAGKSRPSKFDSGQQIDFIQLDNENYGISKTLTKHTSQTIVPASSNLHAAQDSLTASQATAAMSNIMKMHELANQQQALKQPISNSSKRSRAINPVRLMANMVMGSSENQHNSAQDPSLPIAHKLVSNLVNTYITPYILGMSQAKLFQYSDPSTMNILQDQQAYSQAQTDNKLAHAPILSSIVAGRANKSGFKLPENPLKYLLSPNLASSSPSSSYLIHKPSNYHKPITSTTLSPISSIQFSDLKDPLDTAESSNSLISQSSLISPAANSLSDQLASLNDHQDSSNISESNNVSGSTSGKTRQHASKWLKNSMVSQLVQGSLRDILALTQLPIGGASGANALLASGAQSPFTSMLFSARPQSTKKLSTAPSVLESNSKHKLSTHEMALGSRIIEELLRFAYILSSGVRTKRDPYLALVETPKPSAATTSIATNDATPGGSFTQRSTPINQASSTTSDQNSLPDPSSSGSNLIGKQIAQKIKTILLSSASASSISNNKAKPRGIMWEMATDPSLAVTVFHLLERASFAVPLGFLLLPFVKMIRSPMTGLDFARLLPPRASHRSVELEELAKRLDLVDKMLSRALRSTHREVAFMVG